MILEMQENANFFLFNLISVREALLSDAPAHLIVQLHLYSIHRPLMTAAKTQASKLTKV